MNLIDTRLLWLNGDATIGLAVLNETFNPKNVLGAEFKRFEPKYSDEDVLTVPFNPEVMYDIQLIDKAKKIVELMGYIPRLYAPTKGQIPMVIYFGKNEPDVSTYKHKVMIIAPRIKDDF